MKLIPSLPLVCAAVLGMSSLAEPASADEGEQMFAAACSECHTAKKHPLDKLRLNRAEWVEAIERMVHYGARIPKGNMSELLDYLLKTHDIAASKADSK